MKQANLKGRLLGAACLCMIIAHSQKRFKVGIGGTLISNESSNPALNAFIAPMLYLKYAHSLSQKLKVGPEGYFMLRSKEEDYIRRAGFAAALLLTLEYSHPQWSLYTGVGPSYVSQSIRNDYRWGDVKASGIYADLMAGAGLHKRNILDLVEMEYTLRFHYLASLSKKKDNGIMLSFIFSFKGIDDGK